MATIATNNPAGRLHALFAALRGIAATQAQANRPLGTVLAEVWDLNWPEDHAGVAVRVADAVVLPDQIEEQITAWADDPRVYADLALAHRDSWRQALHATTNLDASLLNLTQHLNDTNLQGLQIAARALSTVAPEVQPSVDDLVQLASSVTNLLQEVLSADLDEEVRAFLLDQLRLMQDAIARVQVRGVQALYDAFDQVTGATRYRRSPAARRLQDDEPDFAKKFWAVLTNLATVMTLVQGAVALPADFSDLFSLRSASTTTVHEPATADAAGPTSNASGRSTTASGDSPTNLPTTHPFVPVPSDDAAEVSDTP